ncbi:PREDICTED: protein FLOURY 1-like [Ipomoea nil]|uniref:protein FLOURY 1-like n=1 Tax=Ipomoea nil TaxID=35883 RepID=UPI00090155CE|nr:PREDICTED: protein FLOURY 1-like [Ipomoea nil]XP_019165112.1 PREDICTED: protein FLOURY 1-like [Ipomoea nil]
MQILGHLCLLLAICVLEFYRRFLACFLVVMMMDCVACLKHLGLNFDFGCGFLVFGCFGDFFKLLGLLLLFGLGFKALQFSWFCKGLNTSPCHFRGKSSECRCGFCSRDDFDRRPGSKAGACKCGLSRSLKNWNSPSKIDMLEEKTKGSGSDGEFCDTNDAEEQEGYDEDNVFDVMTLRKMVKMERRKAESVHLELEKERMAAASAAQEAMAMILRLQNEKSMIEMESRQYKSLAEEKQLHDQEVIQSLQWLVLKHEAAESTVLGDQLRLRRKRSKLFMRNDEGDHSEDDELSWSSPKVNSEDAIHRELFSSLDLDLSPE